MSRPLCSFPDALFRNENGTLAMRIAVTHNAANSPDASSPASLVVRALAERFGEAVPIDADSDVFNRLAGESFDLVFNMASGLAGEAPEAHIPALLEMLGLPYTGSGPMAMALCSHRARAKEVCAHYGIPTPGFVVMDDSEVDVDDLFPFPLVVKPAYTVASHRGAMRPTGRVVTTPEELAEAASGITAAGGGAPVPVLIEEFVPGREFSVMLVGNGVETRCAHLVETDAAVAAFSGTGGVRMSASGGALDDRLAEAATRLAKDASRAVGARDYCEVVIRFSTELVPHVVAIRPRPEFTAISGAVSVGDIAVDVAECALARYGA